MATIIFPFASFYNGAVEFDLGYDDKTLSIVRLVCRNNLGTAAHFSAQLPAGQKYEHTFRNGTSRVNVPAGILFVVDDGEGGVYLREPVAIMPG